MTKCQQLSLVMRNIIPRIEADVDALKAKGNESAMIDRIKADLDLMQVICGGISDDEIN
jgi:hypothetical protein